MNYIRNARFEVLNEKVYSKVHNRLFACFSGSRVCGSLGVQPGHELVFWTPILICIRIHASGCVTT